MAAQNTYSGTATVSISGGNAQINKVSEDIPGTFALLVPGSVIQVNGGTGFVDTNTNGVITAGRWGGGASSTPVPWVGQPVTPAGTFSATALAILQGLNAINALPQGRSIANNGLDDLIRIDALLGCAVKSWGTLTTPPVPSAGDCHLVAQGASGAWAGHDGQIAQAIAGSAGGNISWRFVTPFQGLRVYNAENGLTYLYVGSGWEAQPSLTRGLNWTQPQSFLNPLNLLYTQPFRFQSIGTGSLNQTVFYHDAMNGFLFDLARTSDSNSAAAIDFGIEARGEPSGSRFMMKGTSANIGISTPNPEARLHVFGGTGILAENGTGFAFFTGKKNLHLCQNAYYNGSGWNAYGPSSVNGSAVIMGTDGLNGYAMALYTDTTIANAGEPLDLTKIFTVQTNGVVITTSDVRSATPNVGTIGNAVYPYAGSFFQTAPVVTSWSAAKENARTLTDAEVAAGLEILEKCPCLYQFGSAIAEKGIDAARLHPGCIADINTKFPDLQSVEGAMRQHGLDPARYGFWCRDIEQVSVTKNRTTQVQKTEERTRTVEKITVVDGKAVLEQVQETYKVPVFEELPLVDANGAQVFESIETSDENGNPVTKKVARTYKTPVMVDTTEEYTELTDNLNADGTPVYAYSLRYQELTNFCLAALYKSHTSLTERIEVLEKKLEGTASTS